MTTPRRIHENIQFIRAQLDRVNARLDHLLALRCNLRSDLLSEIQKYDDALMAAALAEQGSAAVAEAEAVVSE